jgi:hypothetical protein
MTAVRVNGHALEVVRGTASDLELTAVMVALLTTGAGAGGVAEPIGDESRPRPRNGGHVPAGDWTGYRELGHWRHG